MTSLDNSHDQFFEAHQKVIDVAGGCIAPVPFGAWDALCRRDVDSTEFGAYHRCAGGVVRPWIYKCRAGMEGLAEHVVSCLWTEDAALHHRTGGSELGRVVVVVVGGQVGYDMFPAAIVVDRAAWVESPRCVSRNPCLVCIFNLLCHVVQSTNVVALLDIVFQ